MTVTVTLSPIAPLTLTLTVSHSRVRPIILIIEYLVGTYPCQHHGRAMVRPWYLGGVTHVLASHVLLLPAYNSTEPGTSWPQLTRHYHLGRGLGLGIGLGLGLGLGVGSGLGLGDMFPQADPQCINTVTMNAHISQH